MKKNISLLIFSVQNVNSSYWEPHSSFNANSWSLKIDQESSTWLMSFSFLITCLLDNVLALWWEIRCWSFSRYKGDFKQTKKVDFNTFYCMANSMSGQDEQHPALPERARWSYLLQGLWRSIGLAMTSFQSVLCRPLLSLVKWMKNLYHVVV